MRIQGAGLAAGAAMEHHFGLGGGGAERQGGAEGQGRKAPESSHEAAARFVVSLQQQREAEQNREG